MDVLIPVMGMQENNILLTVLIISPGYGSVK